MTEQENQDNTARRWRRHRGLWWMLGTTLVAWAGSWRVIYLEVTRWHHMNARLRFTPPPVPPGAPPPRAGRPVIMALTVAAIAPPAAAVVAFLLVKKTTRPKRDD
ncbi:MAG TPA: hypothetical protein VFG87_26380 [Amycolatopsis sp.]|jgi:hypothetical protein|nr:hypothetical protein [Amycolatopsis sp.]